MIAVTYDPETMTVLEWFYDTSTNINPDLRAVNMAKATGLPWAVHAPVAGQYVWATVRNRIRDVRITEVKIGRLSYKVRFNYTHGRNRIGAWRDSTEIARNALFKSKESETAEEVLQSIGSVFMTRNGTQWETIDLKV